jgi:hypothetical protein
MTNQPYPTGGKVWARITRILATTLLLPVLLTIANATHAAMNVEQVLSAPYFEEIDIQKTRAGKTVITDVHDVSNREIAAAIVCLVKGSPDSALGVFTGDSLPISSDILEAQQLIKETDATTSFEALSLKTGKRDSKEIQHYLKAVPGLDLNLSAAEISDWQALGKSANVTTAEALLKKHLHTRYVSYRSKGLANASSYLRKDGTSVAPGEELRKTESDKTGLQTILSDFYREWLQYPDVQPASLTGDDYFWLKLTVEDRPVFALSHRLVSRSDDLQVVGIRDFYVSHFFDIAQGIAATIKLENGEHLFIYAVNVWISHWNGIEALDKAIGKKYLGSHMKSLLTDHSICE